jgi:hypothetical protein
MSNILMEGPNQAYKQFTDMGDGTHAERVEIVPKADLLTEGGLSEYDRIKVSVGRSCFFAGRQAFTFYQFSVPTGQTTVIKVVSPVDSIVQNFGANLNVASIRIELMVGGTEGGTFNTPLPINKTNTMTTAGVYTPQVTMAAGGTHTGGTIVDMLELLSGTPARQAVASTANENEPFGFGPGTFYIRIINTDGATATGIFRARWEERP